jgi:hypothetical protein
MERYKEDKGRRASGKLAAPAIGETKREDQRPELERQTRAVGKSMQYTDKGR